MKFYLTLSIISMFAVQTCFAEGDSEAKKAKMGITLSEEDSVRTVKATISAVVDGTESPAKGIEVHFYAKKSFGLLPIGDAASTDEKGEASVEFPKDLPGDSLGNVTIIAKVEDNDKTGELQEMKIARWGIATDHHTGVRRALWASGNNAPWPLVIAVTAVVGGVWGIIIYIISLLFKIKKSGKYETA